MQLGLIGLGRMGGNMARRWLEAGHECVGYARSKADLETLSRDGIVPASSLADLVARLKPPRAIWIMIPAGAVEAVIEELEPQLAAGDTLIDGGNSHYVDDVRRSTALDKRGVHYLDVGVSGGIWGREEGYCLMIGGDAATATRLTPLFTALAPSAAGVPPSGSTAAHGYLHCGPSGAGHFVKMVHNGIEYGLMAAYAEGFNLLEQANAGQRAKRIDAETAPLTVQGTHLAYDFDLAAIAELWRHGSVVRSWLLDLTRDALVRDASLATFRGEVSDSGEGRWTVNAAIEAGVPVPVLATALFARFTSRGHEDFANRLLSAMRREFGGHVERATTAK
ncbi:MAG TPA: decarboxylating 6-phosphogluconate dehydrogenase [Gammaproteobacteria bacterium]|nr:decarboxylating 6-phosphogluconate dehydrogenase [Gammaproteobacteria bacterium]